MYKKEISQFVEEARKYFENKDSNVLGVSIGNWLRYFDFLEIILEKYESLNTAYIQASGEQMALIKERADTTGLTKGNSEITELYNKTQKIGIKLHLAIESFYIFSQVLLDRIADSIRYFFGIKYDGLGSTHIKLKAKWDKFVVHKNIEVKPLDIYSQMESLGEIVTKYRNTEIQHLSEPRKLFGSTWGPDKKVKIYSNVLYPTESESENIALIQKSTIDPSKLLSDLKTYAISVTELFTVNFNRSNLTKNSERK